MHIKHLDKCQHISIQYRKPYYYYYYCYYYYVSGILLSAEATVVNKTDVVACMQGAYERETVVVWTTLMVWR